MPRIHALSKSWSIVGKGALTAAAAMLAVGTAFARQPAESVARQQSAPPPGDPRALAKRLAYPPGSAAAALPQLTPTPVPNRVTAVKVYVSDIDRALKFYTDLFDLDVLGKTGTREVILCFRNAPLQPGQPRGSAPQPLLILIIGPNSPPVAVRNPTMLVRVDLPAMKTKAASLGVQLDMVRDAAGRDITGFGRDPDGNWFQVYR